MLTSYIKYSILDFDCFSFILIPKKKMIEGSRWIHDMLQQSIFIDFTQERLSVIQIKWWSSSCPISSELYSNTINIYGNNMWNYAQYSWRYHFYSNSFPIGKTKFFLRKIFNVEFNMEIMFHIFSARSIRTSICWRIEWTCFMVVCNANVCHHINWNITSIDSNEFLR